MDFCRRASTTAGSSGDGSLHRQLVEVSVVRYRYAYVFLGAIVDDRGEGTQSISRRGNGGPAEEHLRPRDEFLHYAVGAVFSFQGWTAVARCLIRSDSDGRVAQVKNLGSVRS